MWLFCHTEPVVITGRSWNLLPAAGSARPCPPRTPGASLKATRTWCSRRRPPLRISSTHCSPSLKPSAEYGDEGKIHTRPCHQGVGEKRGKRKRKWKKTRPYLSLSLCLQVIKNEVFILACFCQDHFSIKTKSVFFFSSQWKQCWDQNVHL